MILVDANLLVYARLPTLPQHERAHMWLDGRLSGSARVGMPWGSLLAFLRLVTNRRIFERPETLAAAWRQVETWLGCPSVWVPEPGVEHRAVLGRLLAGMSGGGDLVPDAHLAALAIEHGLVLCSTDGDFGRFAGLQWENPLAPRIE